MNALDTRSSGAGQKEPAVCQWCRLRAPLWRVSIPHDVYEKFSCDSHLDALKRVVKIDHSERSVAMAIYEHSDDGWLS